MDGSTERWTEILGQVVRAAMREVEQAELRPQANEALADGEDSAPGSRGVDLANAA